MFGLHWYLKYWCGAHILWDKTGGIQIASVPKPGSLPPVKNEGVLVRRPVPWYYYQNVVTSSYSDVWWDWNRWEKEIDWMALQGINLPLAFTCQESIWQKVFKFLWESGPLVLSISLPSETNLKNSNSGDDMCQLDDKDFDLGGPIKSTLLSDDPNTVDMTALIHMTDEDLKALGMPMV